MSNMTVCNQCGEGFLLERASVNTVVEGELAVQYFSCPACGTKYQIITADARARELIALRKELQRKIGIARAKKFRPKTLQRYVKEAEELKAEQKQRALELRPLGEEILRRLDEPENAKDAQLEVEDA